MSINYLSSDSSASQFVISSALHCTRCLRSSARTNSSTSRTSRGSFKISFTLAHLSDEGIGKKKNRKEESNRLELNRNEQFKALFDFHYSQFLSALLNL